MYSLYLLTCWYAPCDSTIFCPAFQLCTPAPWQLSRPFACLVSACLFCLSESMPGVISAQLVISSQLQVVCCCLEAPDGIAADARAQWQRGEAASRQRERRRPAGVIPFHRRSRRLLLFDPKSCQLLWKRK